jgi:hypothetical protein
MKILKILILTSLSFLFVSAQIPGCGKLRLVSATVQKTIPGHRGAEIKEEYIFICKKSKSSNMTITNLWKGDAKKGQYIDYKIMKYKGDEIINKEINTLSGVKMFAIVATYKYPVDIANNPVEKSTDLCPIDSFEGKAIIEYSKKSKNKYLIVSDIKKLETITKR